MTDRGCRNVSCGGGDNGNGVGRDNGAGNGGSSGRASS